MLSLESGRNRTGPRRMADALQGPPDPYGASLIGPLVVWPTDVINVSMTYGTES